MPKRQQFHATVELLLHDPQIAAEDKILEKLMVTARKGIANRSLHKTLDSRPALYTRYRRTGFPIRTEGNRKYPAWRSLSPWLKLQLASICIAEQNHVQVRLRLHDQIVEELEQRGGDYRSYLRDRLTEGLRIRFGERLHYLFVLEDLDQNGTGKVRTHAHGMIMLPHIDLLAASDGRTRAANGRLINKVGQARAEFIRAREAMKEALQHMVGNRSGRPRIFNGVDQAANVWTKQSYNPLFNKEAISYAYKNVDAAASGLPANRIARSKDLVGEARRFWNLVRKGEQAIDQWPER